MSRHHVVVHQLATGRGAFLNVIDEAGCVGVWGCSATDHTGPVTLIGIGKTGEYTLIQFDNAAWAQEWADGPGRQWSEILTFGITGAIVPWEAP